MSNDDPSNLLVNFTGDGNLALLLPEEDSDRQTEVYETHKAPKTTRTQKNDFFKNKFS